MATGLQIQGGGDSQVRGHVLPKLVVTAVDPRESPEKVASQLALVRP